MGSSAGYTLVEMLFVAAIIIIVVAALFAAQLVGMRIDQLVQSKCGASDSSRRTLQQLPKDIRTAKMWFIGNLGGANGTNFTAITSGPMQGPALELCQTSAGTQFTIYYFTNYGGNVGGVLMKSLTSNWNPTVVASNLFEPSGNYYFYAENYAGVTQTNSLAIGFYKNVIHVTLDFYQFQYPLTQVGTNGLYDYYKMEFRSTPHLPE